MHGITYNHQRLVGWFMVLTPLSFNNISENHRPAVSHLQTLSLA